MQEENNNMSPKDTSVREKKMRYYICYPPTKSTTIVDVGENVRVDDIVQLIKQKFGLKVHNSGASETSIVLSNNGFDLKPNWCFADLSIPSGSMLRCIYREEKAADVYVYCGYNQQILKLFDSSITMETQISTIRQKIANKLGLPLSTFCLETYTGTQRLYDEMKLINYDIKVHDHVYLKVWRGYEKFIGSCVKGFTGRYSPDELTRHYQTQVALHIAAFHGYMELASSAMRQGARSDRPVGEPPSRQWSSDTNIDLFPEMLRCPIHIAIERGHVIMVDLFVRQSVLCTQTRDPITGALPYRLALACSAATKDKEEKRCYNSIYFYLYNKQYYSKIPLNANGEYISNLLASTGNTNAVHRPSPYHVNVSLPFYCRIIGWCDRAREKVWKRFGGQYSTMIQTKRIYPEKGLLGYKVLIDGYNNTFEVPAEQLRYVPSRGSLRADQVDRSIGLTDEEREKIIRTKTFMKQFSMDERRHFKQIVTANIQSRRPPLPLLSQASIDLNKNPIIPTQESEGKKLFKRTINRDNSLASSLNSATQREGSHTPKEKIKRRSHTFHSTSPVAAVNGKNKQTLAMITSLTSHTPTTLSTLTNQLETVANNNNNNNKPQAFQSVMSSADAYLYSSIRFAREIEQSKEVKRRELLAEIKQSFQNQQQQQAEKSSTPLSDSISNTIPVSRSSLVDINSRLPLPDHPTYLGSGPIKSHLDLKIRQSTFGSYERYASASKRSTAINCLQEAGHFKRKPWVKQVEISQEMVKNKVQRRIGRADEINNKSTMLPRHASTTKTSLKSNTVKAN